MKALNKELKENKVIWIIAILLFLERVIVAFFDVGVKYNIASDDASYVISGIVFANTGQITMHGVLSAQIMPGMPVLIGLFSLIFGEGYMLWLSLKLLWFIMGALSAVFIYKSVTIFAPKWCGVMAVLPLFGADFVWMDNLILTETPFMLCLTIMIYSTLMMGKDKSNKYFIMCTTSYMAALMFKANIGIYPVFAMIYLLVVKYDFKRLLKQGLILGCVLLCFIIPWSVRNYIHYDAFIPLTWGSGNPMLLGTYQGTGYPTDEELDYETNVEEVTKAKFHQFYDENGNIKADYLKWYIGLEKDGIKAKYRMSTWFKNDPRSMIYSYLWLKPKSMINSVFYWDSILGVDLDALINLREVNLGICILGVIAAFYLKKYRAVLLFMLALYMGNIYLYAMTFAFDRYAATLMPMRFVMMGIGIYLCVEVLRKIFNQVELKEG